ncbi:MAG TPA: response regulator transcription factor, partial [Actinomycetota bacterium]|nr:response regulator transcription factor [Actinomycetota bacterium]
MPIRVVLGDDHTLVRQGLRRAIEQTTDIDVVGEAATGTEILRVVKETEPDIAVLDIRMPEMDGIEAARHITGDRPEIGIVMLTAYDDRHFVVEAVRAGAKGYVLKTRDADHLLRTVRLVAEGNMVIDPELVVAVADELSSGDQGARGPEKLTERELEILQLLAFGYTNREIGGRLFISADTVKTHLEHVYQKLGASDRTAAVAEAMRR